jgi:type II secretory pathway pseudopilin PulG
MAVKQQGMTLIEVMVALVLLMAASVIMAMSSSAFKGLRGSQSDTVAINFARAYIDSLKSTWNDTGYLSASLPNLTAPDNLKYRLTVTEKNTGDNTIVVKCTDFATTCTGTNLVTSTDAAVLSKSLRSVSIEIQDANGRVKRLSTIIARAAFTQL